MLQRLGFTKEFKKKKSTGFPQGIAGGLSYLPLCFPPGEKKTKPQALPQCRKTGVPLAANKITRPDNGGGPRLTRMELARAPRSTSHLFMGLCRWCLGGKVYTPALIVETRQKLQVRRP